MKMKIVLLLTLLITSCDELETALPPEITVDPVPRILGADTSESTLTFGETYAALKTALTENENISVVAEVDHSNNAASVDLILPPTKIIFFGNPKLGTPLMQKNQLAGLDLPQKMLVFQEATDSVYLAYNNTEYLKNRHGLDDVATLPMIEGALKSFATGAGKGELEVALNNKVELGEGIITKTSNQNFVETYKSLRTAIEDNENLKIVAQLSHHANAESVDMELDPTRLIIFGNPKLGSPLMQNAQTTALDLPQKMLVWRDADKVVHVSYNDPAFLVKRHGITENKETLETIATALDNLSNVAVGN